MCSKLGAISRAKDKPLCNKHLRWRPLIRASRRPHNRANTRRSWRDSRGATLPANMETPPVGSLVVPSPKFRETMGTGEGAALLLALSRGSGRLFYAATDTGYWVQMNEVRAIPREAVPDGCLEALLTDLLLFVGAEECSIDDYAGDSMELAVETAQLTRAQLAELETRFAEQVQSIDFAPRNMSRILLRIHLLFLPAPARTGT